jgi:hypothetical protein
MFNQLKRIQQSDQTLEQAIESYGSFVSYHDKVRGRVAKSNRKDWSTDRLSLSKCVQAVPLFHGAIRNKFGMKAMREAINAHPFK